MSSDIIHNFWKDLLKRILKPFTLILLLYETHADGRKLISFLKKKKSIVHFVEISEDLLDVRVPTPVILNVP